MTARRDSRRHMGWVAVVVIAIAIGLILKIMEMQP